jgi:CubicO group peptidase (beta-lactamase class C family)
MIGPSHTHISTATLYASSSQIELDTQALTDFVQDLATQHPAAYRALTTLVQQHQEDQLKQALQAPDEFPDSLFLSLLTPALREQLARLSHTQAYPSLAKIIREAPSHTDGVKHTIYSLFAKASPLFAPIQTTYQQLKFWVSTMISTLAPLFEVFIPKTSVIAYDLAAISEATDLLIEQKIQEEQIPSVVVAVVYQGQVVKTSAYGKAQDNEINSDDKLLAANTQTVYRLDSLTKQFTATAMMKLVERGLVKLDEPISTYIKNTPQAWDAITIRHLITHHAGFQYQLEEEEYPTLYEQDQYPVPQDYLAQLFAQKPEPGKYIYSNIGYDLLGVVIKNVTQKPYSGFMKETFFAPLQMKHTGSYANASNTDNFAIGYALQPGPAKTLTATNSYPDIINEDIPLAAAGILSTIEDMVKWELALQGDDLLSTASKRMLEQSFVEVWAPGKTDRGAIFLSASGVGWGYNTSFIRYPASHSAVIVMANFDGTGADSPDMSALAFEIAQLYPLG